MFAAQHAMHDPVSVRIAILLVIAAGAVFWRAMIKLMAVAAVLLAAWGAFALLQAVH
jgi:hypothetical protein